VLDAVTVPPVAVTGIEVPDTEEAPLLLIAMAVDVALEAIVRLTVATTPLAMVVAFKPYARQVNEPAPAVQVRLFEALFNADPAVAEMLLTLAAGNVRVHWMAAG